MCPSGTCRLPEDGHGRCRVKNASLKRSSDAAPQLCKEVKSILRQSRVARQGSRPGLASVVWRRLKMLRCCPRRLWSEGRVKFRGSVRVLSFPRTLGGSDAVPTDGSTVALGLGHVPKESQVKLARCSRNSDQISWMPTEMRERVLMECMGKENYEKVQEIELPEMTELQAQRKSSVEDNKNITLMPQSIEEACKRARKLTDEVAAYGTELQRVAALRRLGEAPSPVRPGSQTHRSVPFAQAKSAARKVVAKLELKEVTESVKLQLKEEVSSEKDVVVCSPARARRSLPLVTCEASAN